MKRNSRMHNLMSQFSYDHKKLDARIMRIRRSAQEVSRMLDNMTKKEEKEKN